MKNHSFSDSEAGQSRLIPTAPDKLKIGMHVDLNCSWFKHPFASRTFTITSAQQLDTIRSLGLTSVLVDPALSGLERPDAPAEQVADTKSAGACDAHSSGASVRLTSSDDVRAQRTVTRYSESLQQADTVYQQTLSQGSKALNEIRNGSESGLVATKEMVNSLTDLLLDDGASSAMSSLLGTRDLNDSGVLHAMNVSVLCMLVGRQFDLSREDTQTLGLAGLLHDIGEQLLPVHIQHSDWMSLSPSDRQSFQQHVELGLNMLSQFPGLPRAVRDIIRHHHERIDGSGYPSQFKGTELPLLSRILMVVDEYESLINAANVHHNMTPTEALAGLYRGAKTKYSEEVVIALIQILSVYPPGTVVELNDSSIGLVISINLRSRMRPLIILYDAAVDQNNPNVADLSCTDHLSIVRSIARAELPQEISEYLNLTRWTGYFVKSSMKALEDKQAA